MGASKTAPMSETLSPENAEVRTTTFFRGIASLVAPNLACAFFERVMRRTVSFFFVTNRAAVFEKSVANMLILFPPIDQ
jgi:hypothetical protein